MNYIRLALFAKKYWRQILYVVMALILLIVILPASLLSSLIPDGEDEDIQRYVQVANELGLDWKELVAFDMARYDNNIKGRNPNEAAIYFIEIHYEEFEEARVECVKEVNKKCVEEKNIPERVTKVESIKGKQFIESFFKRFGLNSNNISESLTKINQMKGKRVNTIPVSLTNAMNNAGFTDEQKDRVFEILESGILEELFPDYGIVGMLPGACVGDLSPNGVAKVNSKVQRYDPIIRKYAQQFGIEPYVEIMKALMMAESGGRGTDPMQSSESGFNKKYPNVPGGIKDPEYSIYVGVQEFKQALERANYDILTAIQSYNFGPYFAVWIRENGGKYTLELAEKYSNEYLYPNFGVRGTPNHALKVAKYYQDNGCTPASYASVVGANGWAWPTKSTRVTATFDEIHNGKPHNAIDIGATTPGVAGDPVWAMADGVVTYSGLITGGGNSVFIDHGNGVVSRYIHLDERLVKNGQVVKKGQIIGKMGGTGGTRTKLIRDAYPVHLDFQIKINGVPVDPLQFFKNVK
ncbi:lysozyme family protein [Anoxybacillus rupiensis]|uniref:Lysozyme family protein n=1 Tax=Anoxybacteroides rupiense TaxID=311460 RepID=A0ABD5IW89_9BACL|nr:lysozyme family protein [Anoxybacillus rupiensis]